MSITSRIQNRRSPLEGLNLSPTRLALAGLGDHNKFVVLVDSANNEIIIRGVDKDGRSDLVSELSVYDVLV